MSEATDTIIETPWQGSGVAVDENLPLDAKGLMVQANLDWEVEARPMLIPMGGPGVTNNLMQSQSHKAIIRKKDDLQLGVVGKGWEILQNHEVFTFIDDLVGMNMVKYHSAGSFKKDKVIWVQAEFAEGEIVPGDVHKKYLLFVNAFDGTFSIRIGSTNIRVICMNTMIMAAREAAKTGVSIRHTASMKEKLEAAKTALIIAEDNGQLHDKFQKALTKLRMTGDMWNKFGQALIPDPEEGKNNTRAENSRNQLISLATTGIGQDIPGVAGTGYAAFCALTEYTNYHRTARGVDNLKKQNGRFYSALFGSGGKLIQKGANILNDFLVDSSIQV